jgi:protein-tyrosine phosphatase
MAPELKSRYIRFEEIINFRDLGGYRNDRGRAIAWRKIFRSGELEYMTEKDAQCLQEEIGLKTIIDLRSTAEVEAIKVEGPFARLSIQRHNIPFFSKADQEKIQHFNDNWTSYSEFYVFLIKETGIGERIVNALRIIAEQANHPVMFHCVGGKDRTGVLAAMILSILGVPDREIIEDYVLTAETIHLLAERHENHSPEGTLTPRERYPFTYESPPEAMEFLINTLRQDFGSVRGYLEAQGAEASLFKRLENTLLE